MRDAVKLTITNRRCSAKHILHRLASCSRKLFHFQRRRLKFHVERNLVPSDQRPCVTKRLSDIELVQGSRSSRVAKFPSNAEPQRVIELRLLPFFNVHTFKSPH